MRSSAQLSKWLQRCSPAPRGLPFAARKAQNREEKQTLTPKLETLICSRFSWRNLPVWQGCSDGVVVCQLNRWGRNPTICSLLYSEPSEPMRCPVSSGDLQGRCLKATGHRGGNEEQTGGNTQGDRGQSPTTRRRRQVAKPADCKSATPGSSPGGASNFLVGYCGALPLLRQARYKRAIFLRACKGCLRRPAVHSLQGGL